MYPLTKRARDNYHRPMEKEKLKILVRDVQTQQVLFECDLNEPEKAGKFAADMEEMGLDIEVMVPTLSDTLLESLGMPEEVKEAYKAGLETEIESHEDSCCFSKEE